MHYHGRRFHMAHPIVIVGAGLAGLCCARELSRSGRPFLLLEAADGVGGRVRTDRLDGFLLDRGFQVLLTAYPEAQAQLDYAALDLKAFMPGALVRADGAFHKVVDPWRRPLEAVLNALSPIGSLADKARVGLLRQRLLGGSLDDLGLHPEQRTSDLLRDAGFSDAMIDRFFRPFFGGVLFDRDLHTSSRMFEFVFRMFATGDTVLPAAGMEAIPRQLASALPPDAIRTGERVSGIADDAVVTVNGERIAAQAIVIATDGAEAARLLDAPAPRAPRGCTCVYFAADRAPTREPLLVLDGERSGPVNNLAVVSNVAPSYAPAGAALISATLIGTADQPDELLVPMMRHQLTAWFGSSVSGWRHLRSYRIRNAQPEQTPPALDPISRPVRVRAGLYVCGDHLETASIHGAMRSGRLAGEACLADLG
jgi:phytoene dehydrogenase-like protein